MPVPADDIAAARALHRAGRLDEAERRYRELLARSPSDGELLHLLGVVSLQRGRFAAAREMIGRAIAARPDEASYHNTLGELERACGRTAEAAQAYQRATAIRPDYADALFNLGRVRLLLGEPAQAAADLARALALRPDLPGAQLQLASAHGALGDQRAAAHAYRAALAREPANAAAWRGLGNALFDLQDYAGATEALSRALAAEPGEPDTASRLGRALLETGKPAEAERVFRTALSGGVSFECLGGLAEALDAQKQNQEADGVIAHALALVPPGRNIRVHKVPPARAAAPARFAVCTLDVPQWKTVEKHAEVAEAIRCGLEGLGFEAVVTRELMSAERRHIVLASLFLEVADSAFGLGPVDLAEDAVLVQLEQLGTLGKLFDFSLLPWLGTFETWEYSARNLALFRRLGFARARHLPLGYAPTLERIGRAEQDVDVLFFGTMAPRRRRILDRLSEAGLRVVALTDCYGAERDAWIARAKIVLNVHLYPEKIFEVVRVFYLLINRKCVVSETGHDPLEAEFAGAIAFAPYDGLVETCLRLAGDARERARLAEAGHALMRARPMAEALRPLVLPGG